MYLRKLFLVLSASTCLILPSQAQQVLLPASVSQNAAIARVPDVKALKYFAINGEDERFRKELERLERLYPGFRLPTNFGQDTTGRDQSLWDLFAQGSYSELEAKLAEIQKDNPYWSPDPNLVQQLGFARERNAVIEAFDAGDYAQVVKLAEDKPELIKYSDPELVWDLAASLASVGKSEVSIEAFEYGLREMDDPTVVSVLVQKAARHLPVADATALYRLAAARAEISGNNQLLNEGFGRGLVIRSNEFGIDFPKNHIDVIEEFGERSFVAGRLNDVEMLAWGYYVQKNYESSLRWFSKLPESADNPKAVEGRILSLKHLNKLVEAREKAAKWKGISPEVSALYINLSAPLLLEPKAKKLAPEFLAEFASMTRDLLSGEGAEALGWYAFNVRQGKTADAWFDKALEWRMTETAAFGKTLTAALLRDREQFDVLKAQYSKEYPSIAELAYWTTYSGKKWSPSANQQLSLAMSRAYDRGQYGKCVTISDKLIRKKRANANDYQLRGWCLMKLERPAEARQAFADSLARSKNSSQEVRQASSYGYSLTSLETGEHQAAARVANSSALDKKQSRTIQSAVLERQIIATFNQGEFRTAIGLMNKRRKLVMEPRYMTELRGWAYYKIGKFKAALQVFEAVDSVVSTSKSREAVRVAGEKVKRYVPF